MLDSLVRQLPGEDKILSARPYINHSVQFKTPVSANERARILEEVGLNVFFYPAEFVTGCDFLSDSGTTTMTDKQWASLHLGDESYGSNRGYFKLMEQIDTIFGPGFSTTLTERGKGAFLFHQGRPGENALFTALAKILREKNPGAGEGYYFIPSNGHFDTTEANIHNNAIEPVNLFHPDLKDPNSKNHFKGNMDLERLKTLLKQDPNRIPLIYLTITNNTGGGQPVSMANIMGVRDLARRDGIPFFFDACRFAENAWFIQKYEEGFSQKSIGQIVRQMFSCVDGFTISYKKDGLVDMGGGVHIRREGRFVKAYPGIEDALWNHQILTEGNDTYGGMSGRDLMALVEGLKTITQQEYLDFRISQVQRFGERMNERVPGVVMPVPGHAVYLDMDKFFEGTGMKRGDYAGIGFTAVLLAAYGHRACELGNFAFGSCNAEGDRTFPELNLVRLAVPRLRYENQDLDSAVDSVQALYDNRSRIPPVDVVRAETAPLRHFKAGFKFRN